MLTKSLSLRRGIFLLALASLLIGCTAPSTPAAPTLDPTQVMDWAIQTVEARVTQDAIDHPTATAMPTATPLPTETPMPSPTPMDAFTATPQDTTTPVATETPTTPPVAAKALYAVSYPDPKVIYTPNETFGLALGFQNVGNTAWGPGFTVRMVGFEGEATVQQELSTNQSVDPGGKIEFDLWAFGSETLGKHVWLFQLYSPEGVPIPGGNISYTYTSE